MPPLRGREGDQLEQASRLGGVVGFDRGLEMLAERSRLPELAAQPAEEAHRRLVGHGPHVNATASVALPLLGRIAGILVGRLDSLFAVLVEAVRAQP